VKPDINSVYIHPQLSNNGYPMDGVLVGAGSPWSSRGHYVGKCMGQACYGNFSLPRKHM
jgi:hypothetical protein